VKGEPFKKCGCKDANRRNLNQHCPRLSERNHGAWYYRYSEPAGPDGVRRQPLIGPFPTKTAAATDRIERLNRAAKGLPSYTDRRIRIGDDFDRWCEAKRKISPRTRQANTEIGELYIKPGIGHLRLADLRAQHLEDLYTAIRRIGRPAAEDDAISEILRRLLAARDDRIQSHRRISGARLRRIHDVVRAYLTQRARQEIIPRNPATHIELPSGKRPQALVWTPERVERWLRTGRRPSAVMIWTPEQTGLFLDFAAEDRHYALWHLIAFRGLRRGEAIGLDRSEINWQQATMNIRTSSSDETATDLDLDDNRDGQVTTKNQKSRTISLDRGTLHVLTQYRERQIEQEQRLAVLHEDSGRVFTDELGRPLVPKSVSQNFDRLVARYESIRRSPERTRGRGVASTPRALASSYSTTQRAVELALNGQPLPPVRLHDLRHGAASLTYRATKDLKLVSELLGHSGIQITADTYTTLFADVDAAAAEAVVALVPRTYRTGQVNAPSESPTEPGVQTMCKPEDIPDTKFGHSDPGPGL
jgi:integrase